MRQSFLTLLFVIIAPLSLCSQTMPVMIEAKSLPRPVTQQYELQIGGAEILDTYLSPLVYRGIDLSLRGAWCKALPSDPAHLSMRFRAGLTAQICGHEAFSSKMYATNVEGSWGLHYGFSPRERLRVNIGGSVGLDAGVFYLANNGNNPASARAWTGIAPEASVSYSFMAGKLPVKVEESLSLPSLGVFFSPQYGESYYEIWIGNHSGLAHVGWWGNCFRLSNYIGAEFKFMRGSLKIGYQFGVKSTYVNHLNSQLITHSVGIGYVPSYNPPRKSPDAIYAEY